MSAWESLSFPEGLEMVLWQKSAKPDFLAGGMLVDQKTSATSWLRGLGRYSFSSFESQLILSSSRRRAWKDCVSCPGVYSGATKQSELPAIVILFTISL